jgi:gamma-glutamyltranspeptidase/glutathione hydrolase
MPPPSAGGVTLMITLLTLDHLRAHERKDPAQNQHLFIEASRRSQAERRFSVADPDRWAPNERNRELARWTNPELFLRRAPIDERQSTPSSRAHPLFSVGLKELEHTTHFSIIDREGNVVSCTTTLSAGFGAKIVVPGADIVLNNSVAAFGTAGKNRPLAGFRSTSSMAPALVLNQGRPVLVLGSPGGDTIPSTIAQVLRNVVDASMTIDEAVEAPRIHHGFVPDKVFYERERPPPPKLLRELRLMGHELAARAAIGDANNVLIDDEGTAWLEVDPREGGLALAVKPAEPP